VLVHWAIAADGNKLYDQHKSIVGLTWLVQWSFKQLINFF
jgi:hypothetical protein